MPQKASDQRLRPGLPGYLIPFATQGFVSQRQEYASELLSLSVFPMISTDSTPTPSVPLTPHILKPYRFHRASEVEPRALTVD